MADYLVIVESPSKARTIEKFLGKKYKVLASVGHVRDLPKSKLGVDVDADFEPQYITIRGKGPVIQELKREKAKVKKVLIATDPDREGEAIAWHLQQSLEIPEDEKSRVTFQEITKDAVKKAISAPRHIDQELVDSQQARRILDRLVGYQISPILWRKVMKGLSAGRVQSVATRLIVQREQEIRAFVPEEYWRFALDLQAQAGVFTAEVQRRANKKLSVNNAEDAKSVEEELKKENFQVHRLDQKERRREPFMSYTTSTLQQDASNRLNFSSSKTMMVAQKLYEGIRIKGGTQGLITYMRTDSTRISEEAAHQAASFVQDKYGKEYHQMRRGGAAKGAQDAHEAVRPTDVNLTPESLESYLDRDQMRLYRMIWQRFVASQMKAARYETSTAELTSDNYQATARGERLLFEGFTKVYPVNGSEKPLPELEQGEKLTTKKVHSEQKFTQPPSRYTEASLIKEMEEMGIGRPSTYAPTLYTIIKRGYVVKEKKSLVPTELGEITNTILEENFLDFVETDFTAEMERRLDAIADGEDRWQKVVGDYYSQLKPLVHHAEENVKKYDLSELTDIPCDKCGAMMLIKKTIKGSFYACSNYPECKNTKPILKEIGVQCPLCHEGQIVERKTKKLRTFYGCSRFPDCRFASWTKPVNKPCPKCGSLLSEGNGRNRSYLVCTNKECDHREKRQKEKSESK